MHIRAFYFAQIMNLKVKPISFFTSLTVFVAAFSLIASPAGVCAKDEPYRIGREDVLDISVWQSPELTKPVIVESDGAISYGVLGRLPAAGLTLAEVEKNITQKLAQGYVNDPKVSVSVKEYNSKKILVFGEVGKPGLYKIRQALPLLEMLFLVGGVKPDAKRMTVIRAQSGDAEKVPEGLKPQESPAQPRADGSEKTVREVDLIALLSKGDLSQNILIEPGDTIYVATGTGQKFYVLGQVRSPGPIEWTGEVTVLEAIKLADGAGEQAALNRILVRKNVGGKAQEIKVNVMDIVKGKKKDDVVIEPGTVVIVPRSWV